MTVTTEEVITGIVVVTICAALFTWLDKKYKWARLPYLYKKNTAWNFLVNFIVLSIIALISFFAFGY